MALVLTLLVSSLALSGCAPAGASDPRPTPKVKPPVIGKAGVLRAAVDEGYPPFSAVVSGERVGLDVDVASALAERLGLELQLVPLTADSLTAAVRDGDADIALGGLAMSESVLADASFAGAYVVDGPAFFSVEASAATLATVRSRRVAVQKGSPSYWLLKDEMATDRLGVFPTLRDAFAAVASGTADVAAGDAIVGAYLARDFPELHFAGQLGDATPLGVIVSKDEPELEAVVRDALDTIATNGVLPTIQRKWVDGLPELKVGEVKP